MARMVRGWPAAAYRSAASSTERRKECSSVDGSRRGCSLMFAWYHRVAPRFAGYPHAVNRSHSAMSSCSTTRHLDRSPPRAQLTDLEAGCSGVIGILYRKQRRFTTIYALERSCPSEQKNAELCRDIVGISNFRSRNMLRISQLVSEINKQP